MVLPLRKIPFLLVVVLCSIYLLSCDSDQVGDSYYTFTGETAGSYIVKHPEQFSEFAQLLDTTGVMGLLKSYGNYTVFVPDNEAMFSFYQSKGRSSLEEFTTDTLKKIVYDHIIKGYEIKAENFVSGFLPDLTMSGRNLKISFEAGDQGLNFYVNTSSKIVSRDIEVHNGVIHKVNEVLNPTVNTIVEAIAAEDKFSLFYEALIETGLDQKLNLIKDESYMPSAIDLELDGKTTGIGGLYVVPRERKYGYTVLMESNETFASSEQRITSIEEMKAYAKQIYDQVYPDDAGITDVKNPKNSFNRFVAYHLINKKIPSAFFIEKYDNTGWHFQTDNTSHSVKVVDMPEYIETMAPNTLIEVSTYRANNEYNVFNRIESTGEAIRLTSDYDNDAINGVYHEIDGILAYTSDFIAQLTSKRIRMDVASFFPEFANNNIRKGSSNSDVSNFSYIFPKGYVDRVKTVEGTSFGYISSDDRFLDYQGDEVFLEPSLYDIEITTLPVPAGTYEVRFGFQPNGHRGVVQFYWDGEPSGIPINMNIRANDPKIGYERPGSRDTDPEGFENDKMMRNRGFMKGPANFKNIDPVWYGNNSSARMSVAYNRKILGIYTFQEDGTHVLRARAVKSGEFMLDFIEFVPLEAIESEDIY